VTCIKSSLADFRLGLDEEAESLFFQGAHVGVEREQQFRAVRVRNPSGAALTVTLVIGFGEFKDSRLSVSAPIDVSDRVARLLGRVDLLTLGKVLDQLGFAHGLMGNPAVDADIISSGDLAAGLYLMTVQLGSSANWDWRVVRRSADDVTDTTISRSVIVAFDAFAFDFVILLALNEEVVVEAANSLVGTAYGNLQWARLKA